MSEKKKSDFGIWVKSVNTKSGPQEVLSFSVNGVRYNAWKNNFKSSEKSPDYNAYVDNYVKPNTPTGNKPLADNTTFEKNSHKPSAGGDSLPF